LIFWSLLLLLLLILFKYLFFSSIQILGERKKKEQQKNDWRKGSKKVRKKGNEHKMISVEGRNFFFNYAVEASSLFSRLLHFCPVHLIFQKKFRYNLIGILLYTYIETRKKIMIETHTNITHKKATKIIGIVVSTTKLIGLFLFVIGIFVISSIIWSIIWFIIRFIIRFILVVL